MSYVLIQTKGKPWASYQFILGQTLYCSEWSSELLTLVSLDGKKIAVLSYRELWRASNVSSLGGPVPLLFVLDWVSDNTGWWGAGTRSEQYTVSQSLMPMRMTHLHFLHLPQSSWDSWRERSFLGPLLHWAPPLGGRQQPGEAEITRAPSPWHSFFYQAMQIKNTVWATGKSKAVLEIMIGPRWLILFF